MLYNQVVVLYGLQEYRLVSWFEVRLGILFAASCVLCAGGDMYIHLT
jgi:hypothetical protein